MKLSDIARDFDAAIFDFDGTLVDSMWMWTDIDIEYLSRFGIEFRPGIQRDIEGMSVEETARYCREVLGIDQSTEEMRADWLSMSHELYRSKVPLKPYAGEFLHFLREHGIAVGIASSSAIENIEVCLRANNIDRYIDLVITSSEVDRSKPAPDVFIEAARRLNVAPARCIAFEDVPAGIRAAKAAGMTAVAVFDESSSELTLDKQLLADHYIHDFSELIS